MARSCGLKRDLRLSKNDVYSQYNLIKFNSYIGINGDTFDRYLIRMLEMGESLQIVNQVTNYLLNTNITNNYFINSLTNTFITNKYNSENQYTSMEDLISHFIN